MVFHSFSIFVALTIFGYNHAIKILGPEECQLSEIGRMNFSQIGAKFGYTVEEKDVITEDSYILTMYHIPGDKTRAVLLVHGNTAGSDSWIIRGETSLAITLARQGYDVWAINLRGTTRSLRHQYLDPDTQPGRFFNFSFYEQGIYDLPASVDLVLQETCQEQLLVIGHSVGTTLLYVMGSERPEYNDKIKVGISLAPICFLEYTEGIPQFIKTLFGPAVSEILKLDHQEILSYQRIAPLLQKFCLQPLGYEICVRLGIFSVFGADEEGLEPEFVPTLLGHYPRGSSVKLFRHLLQVASENKFRQFDYGDAENLEVYSCTEPPQFDLSKVTMKSALFVGSSDPLATVPDSKRLNASLPNVVHYEVLPYEKFNHIDFVWGRHVTDNFYPHLFPVIEKYI